MQHAVAAVMESVAFFGNNDDLILGNNGNVIHFSGIDNLTWVQDKYSISTGQTFSGSSAIGTNIYVEAGRHGTQQPAVDFCNGVDVPNMIASSTAFPHWTEAPQNLNFVVFGTLTFTIKGKQYECKDMRIGQGHYLLTNNWWIGSHKCYRSSFWKLNCGSHLSCGLMFASKGKSDELHVSIMQPGDSLDFNQVKDRTDRSQVNFTDYAKAPYQRHTPAASHKSSLQFGGGWPQKLDYGLYFFSADNTPQKYVPGQTNSFFDPSRPTLIFFHGWQPTTVQHDYRLSFDYHLNDPEFCPRSIPSSPNFWVTEGWNIGIFYWDQFADEPLPEYAEAKIWSADGYVGMRYMTASGDFETAGVQPGSSVTDLFVNTFQSLSETSNGVAPQEMRFAGASLGAQLSVHSAAVLRRLADSGSISSAWLPTRIALLDPFFSERIPVLNPQSYVAAGKSTAALVELEVAALRESGVIFELHRSSPLSDLPAPFGDRDEGLKKHAVYVHRYPNYCNYPTYGAKEVASFSVEQEVVEQLSKVACGHAAAWNLYFLTMGNAPPSLCSAAPPVQGDSCTTPSASCNSSGLRTLSAAVMNSGQEFVQVRGMDTVATDDDCFELRPNQHAGSNPQVLSPFAFRRLVGQVQNFQEERSSEIKLWNVAHAHPEETSGKVANQEGSGLASASGLASLVILVGRLALVSLAFACLMYFTHRKRPSVIVPESLLG
jgi:hypothetical protein